MTQFAWEQVEYLISRMRSQAAMDSYMMISCNPDPDSWILPLIEWYLDDEGYADQEKDGIIRWFVRIDGEFQWGESKEELIERFGPKTRPISFTFISATVYDNPPMMEKNPEYVAFLEGLAPVEKARLLHGNWYAREEGANYFKREWLTKLETIPLGAKCVRGWDKAGTEPTQSNKFPDFTASVKMYKTRDGRYVISGEYSPANGEKGTGIKGRFRRKAGARDLIIQEQAHYDGEDCDVVFPIDAGQAGISEFQESSKKLVGEGFTVRKDPVANNKSKLVKFTPFAAAAEIGLVDIVESSFPDKATLDHFYKELEVFDGERSSSSRKDDIPDALGSAFNYLAKQRVLPKLRMEKTGSATKVNEIKHLKDTN